MRTTPGSRNQKHLTTRRRSHPIPQTHTERNTSATHINTLQRSIRRTHRILLIRTIIRRLVRILPNVVVTKHPNIKSSLDVSASLGRLDVGAHRIALPTNQKRRRRHIATHLNLTTHQYARIAIHRDKLIPPTNGRHHLKTRHSSHVLATHTQPRTKQGQFGRIPHPPLERDRDTRIHDIDHRPKLVDDGDVADHDAYGRRGRQAGLVSRRKYEGGRLIGRHDPSRASGDVEAARTDRQLARARDLPRQLDLATRWH